jgi:uncharacterized protein (TIGR04255 family)
MSVKRPRQPGAKKGASGPLSRFTADLASPSVRPTDLPDYDKPPVVEVASSIQFGTIPGLDAARLGLLWTTFRREYPHTEQQPPLAHEIESFGAPALSQISFSVGQMISPRCWFKNEKGTRLLQVQHDRFVLNWRKLDIDDEEYPHYFNVLRPALEREYARFEGFLREEVLPAPVPDQAELTFVNHIPAGEPKGQRETAARFTRLWSGEPRGGTLPAAEDLLFASRYVMRDERGSPVGRLHVNLQSSYRTSDGTPLYVLQLTARGAPQGEGLAGALAFLDKGHEWIVRGFTDITTPEMHDLWKRKL